MKKSNKYILIAEILLFYAVLFILQRVIVFVNDDLWYATNLVTGQKLSGIADIIESQKWHYMNWGGRSINHGLLQLLLMCGEFADDVLNTAMCAILSFLITKISGAKRHSFGLLATVILIVLNPAFYSNMFWQSGAANYLYSTGWIFCFAFCYLKVLNKDGFKNNVWLSVLMPPLALMTGWSCENMGPASFLFALGLTLYVVIKDKQKPAVWMIEGIVFSLAGSMAMILAPGNYVRSALIEENGLRQAVSIRIYSMKLATLDFLLPTLLFAACVSAVYIFVLKRKLNRTQTAFLIYGLVAHGGMALSPTYPSRAVFGVTAVFTVYIISILWEMFSEQKAKRAITVTAGLLYIVAICKMTAFIFYPPYGG